MAENIKDLIEKIQEEGVKTAEAKAREIEENAKKETLALIEKARAEADEIIAHAREDIAQREKSSREMLRQAGRDLLLSLKKEINALLDKIIISEIKQAMSADELMKIIAELIRRYSSGEKADIVVSLRKEDLAKMEQGFLARLKEETKKPITLVSSEEISGGFIISYDAGKSRFDFSEKALAEYIGAQLKPRLNEMLNSASSDDKKT